jgi:hypothetical protein
MFGFSRIAGALLAALAALGIALLLRSAPEAARWSLMICLMGFVGATMRLRRLDAGF